ncbi:unnamed protein product [Callosobruchus maculatus]|uniref:Uncharacterized protein n=1 Tax=Callosobruchus maculatus TaxID=64391 RepID=A0A653DCI8_CALMS|nr:unnamed protein product [Callosobruchus maculatus]
MFRGLVGLCFTLILASNTCYADTSGPAPTNPKSVKAPSIQAETKKIAEAANPDTVVVTPRSEEAAIAAEIKHKEEAALPAIPETNAKEVPLPLRVVSGAAYNAIRFLPDSPISHTMGFPDTALKPEDLIVDLTGLPNKPKHTPRYMLPPLARAKGLEKSKAIAESKWKELLAVESVAQNETGQKNFLYPREFIAWMEQTMQDKRRLSAINIGILRMIRKLFEAFLAPLGLPTAALTEAAGLGEFQKAIKDALTALGFPVL